MTIPRLLAVPALLCAGACIPYATGTTALPTPQGEMHPTASLYFIPGGLDPISGDSVSGSYAGADFEMRYGVDERSDVGVRIPGFSGVVINYKRRMDGNPELTGPALSYMVGAGVVNMGEHAHVEATLLASARQNGIFTPYGGAKAMHVIPLIEDAVRDDPTLGVFGGIRIGTEGLGISPEIAVFYDRSALGLRDRNWILVPSFTFHGDELFRRLFGGPRHGPDPRPPYPRFP